MHGGGGGELGTLTQVGEGAGQDPFARFDLGREPAGHPPFFTLGAGQDWLERFDADREEGEERGLGLALWWMQGDRLR